MDYVMPGMAGAEFTSEIRRLEGSTGLRLPVIGMTSHTNTVRKECQDSGMDAVLPKDCAIDDLFDVHESLIFARSVITSLL